MKIIAFIFALLLPVAAFAAEQSKPPMSQNAVTPDGNGYVFIPSTGPEGGGRWARATPHPAAQVDTQVQVVTPAAPPQNYPAAQPQAGNPFADPQYADPAQVTQAPPAAENADAPEVAPPLNHEEAPPQNYEEAPPQMTNRVPAAAPAPAYRDPNPPIISTGGGSWSLPQEELDAMAGRPPSSAPKAAAQQQQPQQVMQSLSVTSVEKCLEQLPPAEALEVRTRYVKPYEECRARVGANARQQKTVTAEKQAEALTPETPRNYIRVSVPKETPAAKDNSTAGKADASDRSYITGSPRAKLNP